MPKMAPSEVRLCAGGLWSAFARRVVLPWAVGRESVGPEALEVGGGAGAMAEQLLARRTELRLTVTDVDEQMVDVARARLARFGDRATVQEADATALPFADESFDTIVSFIMLHHVVDWERALAEAFRVLRPGGSLVGYDLLSTGLNRLIHRLDGSPHRLVALDELRTALDHLPVDRAVLVPSLAGHAVRFSLRKA